VNRDLQTKREQPSLSPRAAQSSTPRRAAARPDSLGTRLARTGTRAPFAIGPSQRRAIPISDAGLIKIQLALASRHSLSRCFRRYQSRSSSTSPDSHRGKASSLRLSILSEKHRLISYVILSGIQGLLVANCIVGKKEDHGCNGGHGQRVKESFQT
jgi:hypothetical protein